MTLKNWKELDSGKGIMSEDYYVDDSKAIHLPRELYNKLNEIAKERFGYTGQGIVSDLVENIVDVWLEEERIKGERK